MWEDKRSEAKQRDRKQAENKSDNRAQRGYTDPLGHHHPSLVESYVTPMVH